MKADYKANHRFKIKKRVTYHKLLFSFCGAYRTRTDHLDTASVVKRVGNQLATYLVAYMHCLYLLFTILQK